MMTRCVVVVDGAYLRDAARQQLDGESDEAAVLQNAPALLGHLRALAEEATGEDLLRVYWYESGAEPLTDAAHLASQPYLTVRPGQRNGALGAPDSPLVQDLTTLLDQLGCGDVVICTADPSLAPLFERVQGRCRHVHWVQAGETEDPSTAALWAASDTRVYLSHAVVAESFRVVAAPSRTDRTVLTGATAPIVVERHRTDTQGTQTAASHRPVGIPAAGSWQAWDDEGDPFARPRARSAPDALAKVFDAEPVATRPARGTSAGWSAAAHRSGAPHRAFTDGDPDSAGGLDAIATQVADEVGPLEMEVVRRWQRGVPAEVDRQLLGASYGVLGRRLQQSEKIRLRQAFVAECERQAV